MYFKQILIILATLALVACSKPASDSDSPTPVDDTNTDPGTTTATITPVTKINLTGVKFLAIRASGTSASGQLFAVTGETDPTTDELASVDPTTGEVATIDQTGGTGLTPIKIWTTKGGGQVAVEYVDSSGDHYETYVTNAQDPLNIAHPMTRHGKMSGMVGAYKTAPDIHPTANGILYRDESARVQRLILDPDDPSNDTVETVLTDVASFSPDDAGNIGYTDSAGAVHLQTSLGVTNLIDVVRGFYWYSPEAGCYLYHHSDQYNRCATVDPDTGLVTITRTTFDTNERTFTDSYFEPDECSMIEFINASAQTVRRLFCYNYGYNYSYAWIYQQEPVSGTGVSLVGTPHLFYKVENVVVAEGHLFVYGTEGEFSPEFVDLGTFWLKVIDAETLADPSTIVFRDSAYSIHDMQPDPDGGGVLVLATRASDGVKILGKVTVAGGWDWVQENITLTDLTGI